MQFFGATASLSLRELLSVCKNILKVLEVSSEEKRPSESLWKVFTVWDETCAVAPKDRVAAMEEGVSRQSG